jgi:hypothetical protein
MTNPVWGSVGSLISGTTGSVTPVAPAHVAGDWLFIVAEHANASNLITPTLGGGTAFSLVGAQTNATSTSGLALWAAKATGSSMTIPAIGGNAGQDHIGAVVFVVSGLQNKVGDNPWSNMVVQNLSAASATAQSAGALGAVAAANALVVDIVSRGNDSAAANFSGWANSGLANLTERFDAGTADGNGGGFAINTGDLAAPATLAATTVTSAGNIRWASISLALRSTIDGTATATGGQGASAVGSLVAKGAGGATISGVSGASAIGTLGGTGAASIAMVGASATSAAGSTSAGGDATATIVGVSAASSAGVLEADSDAGASLTGVQANASAGTLTASSPTVEQPAWELQITGFPPERPRGALARVRGVSAVARVGQVSASGAARTSLRGVSVGAGVGTMTATGMTRVFPREPFTTAAAKGLRSWSTATVYRRRKPIPMRSGNGCE